MISQKDKQLIYESYQEALKKRTSKGSDVSVMVKRFEKLVNEWKK